MKETILAISGKPGLYRLVSRGNGTLIVETLDETKKRIPAFARDRVTSLADIAMYTDDEDIALWKVLKSLGEKRSQNLHPLTTRRQVLQSSASISQKFFRHSTANVSTTMTSRNSYSGTTSLSRQESQISRWLSLLRKVTTLMTELNH